MSSQAHSMSISRGPKQRAAADFREFVSHDKEQQRSAESAFDENLYDEAAALIQARLDAAATEAMS